MDSGEEEDSVTEIQLSDSSASYEPSDSELSDCEDNKSDDDESHSKNEKRKSMLNDWVIRKEEKQGKKKPSSSVSSLKAGLFYYVNVFIIFNNFNTRHTHIPYEIFIANNLYA